MVAWIAKELNNLRAHANAISDIPLGSWWVICIRFITPVILGIMMIMNIRTDLTTSYGGYPVMFNFYFGWLVAICAIIFGIVFSCVKKWDANVLQIPSDKEGAK
jgi:NSS family neurotransmitter:Na+ symporter